MSRTARVALGELVVTLVLTAAVVVALVALDDTAPGWALLVAVAALVVLGTVSSVVARRRALASGRTRREALQRLVDDRSGEWFVTWLGLLVVVVTLATFALDGLGRTDLPAAVGLLVVVLVGLVGVPLTLRAAYRRRARRELRDLQS